LGVTTYLELSPTALLDSDSTATLSTVDRRERRLSIIRMLARDRAEVPAVVEALAALHLAGVAVDWRSVFPAGTRPADLPTYAFQRQRYWPDPMVRPTADDAAADGRDARGSLELRHRLAGLTTVEQ